MFRYQIVIRNTRKQLKERSSNNFSDFMIIDLLVIPSIQSWINTWIKLNKL